jgi:hypothetical protein
VHGATVVAVKASKNMFQQHFMSDIWSVHLQEYYLEKTVCEYILVGDFLFFFLRFLTVSSEIQILQLKASLLIHTRKTS